MMILIAGLGFLIGILSFPLLMFVRARRDSSWDNSNITNMYRVIAHLGAHPGDFAKFQYEDGEKPFWYLSKDELSEIVGTRPKK